MPPKQKRKKKKGGNIGKHNAAAREDAGEVASPPSFEFAKGNNFGDDFKVVHVWCNRDGKGWVVKFTYTHTFTTTQKSSVVRLPATNFKEKFKTAIHKAHLEHVAEVEELANRQSDHMDSLESAVQNDTSNPLLHPFERPLLDRSAKTHARELILLRDRKDYAVVGWPVGVKRRGKNNLDRWRRLQGVTRRKDRLKVQKEITASARR